MFFVLTNMGEKKIIQHLNFYQFLGMSYLQKRFYSFLSFKKTLFGSGFLHFLFVFFLDYISTYYLYHQKGYSISLINKFYLKKVRILLTCFFFQKIIVFSILLYLVSSAHPFRNSKSNNALLDNIFEDIFIIF